MSAGAIIARQNMYMRAFRKAGATNAETAKSLKELGIVPIGIFYRMEKAGVFQKTEDGRYFMSEDRAHNYVLRRARYAWIMTGALLIGLALVYLIGGSL